MVAGFLTFLADESLLPAGNAAGLEASVPSYVGGISLAGEPAGGSRPAPHWICTPGINPSEPRRAARARSCG
ncbi:Uncharacterized protein MLTONO_4106 [Mesorhizobium loti]|nr:Uncharacterized protein MLTONO_4106 [Mesorhizobium loti]